MSETSKSFWLWYWRGRSGVVLLPRLRGVRRLVLDIPIFFLGAYVLYLWLLSLPEPGRRFILSVYESPFAIAAVLLILAHQIGVSYMRDRLTLQPSFPARLTLLIPGAVLRLYKEEYGNDSLVRTLRRIGIATVASFAIGVLMVNWTRMHAR
jgi:hypothetical protein